MGSALGPFSRLSVSQPLLAAGSAALAGSLASYAAFAGAPALGAAAVATVALFGGVAVYGALKAAVGLRLDAEAEFNGADLSIHRISSTAERETNW